VRSPKSARRARPSWSIRMLSLIKCALGGGVAISAQIHTPFRSPCIIPSLCIYSNPWAIPVSYQKGFHRWRMGSIVERNHTSSNRFASLCAPMNSLIFPLTIHSETIAKSLFPIVTPNSGSTFGWKRLFHVMTSLQNVCAIATIISTSIYTFDKSWVVTHTCNLVEIACRIYFQNLDCDLATLVFAHPHVSVPATVQCFFRSVEAKWGLEWTRKQSMVTAHPAQCVQTPPLELRS